MIVGDARVVPSLASPPPQPARGRTIDSDFHPLPALAGEPLPSRALEFDLPEGGRRRRRLRPSEFL